MSLYQDLNEGGRYLAEKYNEPDMAKIIDEYCNEVIRDNSDNEIADHYVLKAEKEGIYVSDPPQYSPEVFNKVMDQVENFEENNF